MTQVIPTMTEPTFTPSLGLRFWMNKMKSSKETGEEDTSNQRTSINNDGQSIVSDIGTTRSYPLDMTSSLRVLHHPHNNDTCSDQSSFLSEDIQSTASIKSKPWISQAIPDDDLKQNKRSENELFPLGRIKAGLGRLVLGREHSSPSH